MPLTKRLSMIVQCGVLCLSLAGPAASGQDKSQSGQWVNPVIKEGGKVRPYPEAAAQPQPGKQHKILFSLTRGSETPDKINPGLEHVARLINVYALAKVPVRNLKIVAVLHGDATAAVLDDAHYREKHQGANPNLALIVELRRAGVTLFVCGQALAHAGFEPAWVDPNVKLALAALTVLPIYQAQGYALIPE